MKTSIIAFISVLITLFLYVVFVNVLSLEGGIIGPNGSNGNSEENPTVHTDIVESEEVMGTKILTVELDGGSYPLYSLVDVGIGQYVDDYFVERKRISNSYYEDICGILVNDALEEKLNRSDKLFIYINYAFEDAPNDGQMVCDYDLVWEYDIIESDQLDFDGLDVKLAMEERPAIFNESKTGVRYDEEYSEYEAFNYNRDFDVLLKIKVENKDE